MCATPTQLSTRLLAVSLGATLFLAGCSPQGGDLLPASNEGAETVTTLFSNDSQRISREGIAVTAFGSWRDLNGRIFLNLACANTGGAPVTIDLPSFRIADSSAHSWRPLTRQQSAVLVPGEKRRFAIVADRQTQADPNRDLLGGTVQVTLPITSGAGEKRDDSFRFRFAKSHDAWF